MHFQRIKKIPFPRRVWLIGCGEIAKFTGYNEADVVDWIVYWLDCPIKINELGCITNQVCKNQTGNS